MKTVAGWAYPDADQFMAAEQQADGTYQGSHYRMCVPLVTDRSLAIDCGAHVGTWTRLMSADFARVIAVEPSPDTFEALVTNMQAFGCQNVQFHQAAVGAEAGFVSIAPLDPRAEALKNTGARFVQAGGSIPCERIDDWRLPSCGFIKMDIEGSEPLALEGARETLKRCRPIVLFECKGFWRHRYGLSKDAPQEILRSVGYHELAVAGRDRIWGPSR
jgi:FkbM family methyltransferase